MGWQHEAFCNLVSGCPRHNIHLSTPQFPHVNWIIMRSVTTVVLHHMRGKWFITRQAAHRGQAAAAHSSMMPSSFPPILCPLPHPISFNFCPPSLQRKHRSLAWDMTSSRVGLSRFSMSELEPGASHPCLCTAVTCHPSATCLHMCSLLLPSCLSPVRTSSSYGEMRDALLLRGEGLTWTIAKDEGMPVLGAQHAPTRGL